MERPRKDQQKQLQGIRQKIRMQLKPFFDFKFSVDIRRYSSLHGLEAFVIVRKPIKDAEERKRLFELFDQAFPTKKFEGLTVSLCYSFENKSYYYSVICYKKPENDSLPNCQSQLSTSTVDAVEHEQ